MLSKFLIYGLVDPRDGQLRYVGKSCKGLLRPKEEYARALKGWEGHGYKVAWIKSLYAAGRRYSICIIQELESNEILCQAEVFWIKYFREMGCRLVNGTDGGEGVVYQGKHRRGYHLSSVTREKMRARRHTPETRARMSLSRKGHVVSEDTKKRIRMGQKCRRIMDQNGVVYESVADAVRLLGLQDSNIHKVLKGQLRSTGGYTFRDAP